jgi:hypothetical protein
MVAEKRISTARWTRRENEKKKNDDGRTTVGGTRSGSASRYREGEQASGFGHANAGMTRALLPQIRARPSTPRHNAPSRTRTQFRITMFGPTVVDLENDLNTAKLSRWQKPPSEPL